MRVIGLDLSLTSVGVAVPGGMLHTIEPAHGAEDPGARLDELSRRVWDVVMGARPHLAMIEGYAFAGKNTRGHHGVVELGGCVRRDLWRASVAVVVVSPKTLKKYATGNGNASKEQMVEALPEEVVARNDDEADAWWLRQIGVEWVSGVAGSRADVIAGLAWPSRVVA